MQLLRKLRGFKQAQKSRRWMLRRQSFLEREQSRESQKTKILMSLYLLVLLQLASLFAVFMCWESGLFDSNFRKSYCPIVSFASPSLGMGHAYWEHYLYGGRGGGPTKRDDFLGLAPLGICQRRA